MRHRPSAVPNSPFAVSAYCPDASEASDAIAYVTHSREVTVQGFCPFAVARPANATTNGDSSVAEPTIHAAYALIRKPGTDAVSTVGSGCGGRVSTRVRLPSV